MGGVLDPASLQVVIRSVGGRAAGTRRHTGRPREGDPVDGPVVLVAIPKPSVRPDREIGDRDESGTPLTTRRLTGDGRRQIPRRTGVLQTLEAAAVVVIEEIVPAVLGRELLAAAGAPIEAGADHGRPEGVIVGVN